MDIDVKLSKILGGTYGGPSLSYDSASQQFVIYQWGDAPVLDDILARGDTVEECIRDYYCQSQVNEGPQHHRG